MTVTIIGTDRDGVVKGLDGCRYWAERGLIHFEEKDGNYGTLSIKQCLERLKGLNDMVGRSKAKAKTREFHWYADEVQQYQNYVDDMIELCKKAKEQGDPTDENAQKQIAHDNRRIMVTPGARTRM